VSCSKNDRSINPRSSPRSCRSITGARSSANQWCH